MDSIRCGSCGRRCLGEDAVCLLCGCDPQVSTARPGIARRALTLGGAAILASAVVAAPVLLGACVCTVQQPSAYRDAGPVDAGSVDVGPGDTGISR